MADPIRVVFIDAASGAEFARSDVPLAGLPDSFAPATTLNIGEDTWSVVTAAPGSKPEFARSGRLVLTLSRVRMVDPRDIRYSLPTICDGLPPAGGATSVNTLMLHEDDWRQAELVSTAYADEIRTELRAIQGIVDEHATSDAEGRLTGFDEIHVRRAPETPLGTGIAVRDMWALLPAPDHVYDGVAFRDGPVAGSFAAVLGSVLLYGLADEARVTVLALAPRPGTELESATAGLGRVLDTFGLVAVDWCKGVVADATNIGDLLLRLA